MKRAIVVAASILVCSACVLRGPGDVRREVAAATGADYEREFGLTLGRMSMAVVRWGMKHSDEELPVSLKRVRKIQVGVYHVRPGNWGDGGGPTPFDPDRLGGWTPAVAVREDGEDVHLLLRERGERVRAMLIVVSDPDELVIVRMKGDLGEILQDALRYGLEQADRDDLYEPVRTRMEDEEREKPPLDSESS